MPTSLARAALLALLAGTLAGCASGGAREMDTAASPVNPAVTPPVIVGREYPDLSNVPFDRNAMQLELRVMVNPDGSPDMSTVRVMGTATAATRDAFVLWISRSRFRPGTQGGMPVRAEYHMRMKTKVEVRRVG